MGRLRDGPDVQERGVVAAGGDALTREQGRVPALEILDLGHRPPPSVRVPRLRHEDAGDGRLPAAPPELRVELVGECLLPQALRRPRGVSRRFVERRRLGDISPDPRDFRPDDEVLRLEVVGRVLRPLLEPCSEHLEGHLHQLPFTRGGAGVQRREHERVVEDSQLVPDRAREVLLDDRLGGAGRVQRGPILLEGVEDGELRDEVEHLEEPLSGVGLPVGVLVEGRVGEREGVAGLAREGASPLEDHPLGVGDVPHLDPLAILHVRRVRRVKRRQVRATEQRQPDLVEERPRGVDEEPGFVTEPEGFARDGEGRLEGHAPRADRPREHHEDLGSQRGVVEPLVEALRQEPEFVRGPVLLPDRAQKHRRQQAVRVRRLLDVAVDEREADHRRGVQERQRFVARQEARGMQGAEQLHDRPDLRILHDGETDQGVDGPLAHQPVDGRERGVEGALLLLENVREDDPEEREAFSTGADCVRVAGQVLVLEDLQRVDTRPVQPCPGAREQTVEVPLRLLEKTTEVLTLGRLDGERQHQLVLRLPAPVAEETEPGAEVTERGLVGRRRLGLAACDQIEPRQGQPLRVVAHQLAADVEVPGDVEDLLLPARTVPSPEQEPTNREVDVLLTLARDQGVGGLLDPVVQERVRGRRRRQHQPFLDGFAEVRGRRLRRFFADHGQRLEVERGAETRGERERALSLRRQPLDLPRHQVDDVVRHHRAGDPLEGEAPVPALGIESEQPILLERLQELDHEERVPVGLPHDQLGERLHLGEIPMERVVDEQRERREGNRAEEDAADLHALGLEQAQGSRERMTGVHFVVAVGADHEKEAHLRAREQRPE